MKPEHLDLSSEKFQPLDCTTINHIRGGDDSTVTAGYSYTINGVTKTCASDCFRREADGKWHTYYYDRDGKTMDIHIRP